MKLQKNCFKPPVTKKVFYCDKKNKTKMKEIKFRGQRIDNNKWAYGFLCFEANEGCFIIQEIANIPADDNAPLGETISLYHRIKKETVGQYTGIKDKLGKEIYEGDIIDYYEYENNSTNENPEYHFQYTVVWNMLKWCLRGDGYSVLMWQQMDKKEIQNLNNDGCKARGMEIIGNIHENPELIK